MSYWKEQPKSHFLILYASETGQAKAISEEIAEKATQYGLKPARFCMSLIDKRFSIERETCVVFVVSTTGDGQPPETAIKFFRRLNRSTLKINHLENLNYALLALGDSNYLKFAAFGRQLEYRLKALSAKSFYPTGYGDDAYGIETGVDPWIDNLWPALHKQLGLDFQRNHFVDCYSFQNNIKNSLVSSMNSVSESIEKNPLVKKNCITDLPELLKEIDLEKCHVPKLPSLSYTVIYDKDNNSDIKFYPNESILVVPASAVVKASLIAAKKLTVGEDVKDTLELTFKFEKDTVEYEPGDSFGFLCPNDAEEVEMLLTRLDVINYADVPANLIINKDCTTKKKLPSHIPTLFTLRELFSHHIEIRAVPKKILLRILAEHTDIDHEKSGLLLLSSQEGSDYFSNFIRQPSLSILDILLHFKSCKPPVETIIEYLPPLKPRFYSVASSLVDSRIFRIVFNVLHIKAIEGRMRDRKGVCTGWFHNMASNNVQVPSLNLNEQFSALRLDDSQNPVYIYKRKNHFFKFPNDLKTSVIMVGPGTGIAPFIGYLQHREKLLQTVSDDNSETWLFYGCRYQERDYLYKDELKKFVENGVLQHLVVSHSRDHTVPDSVTKYVHQSIKLYAKQVSDCIRSGGRIYVCGDAKHMVHNVQQAFIEAVKLGFDIRESEAKKFIESLQKEHRYLNDVWA